MTPLNSRRRGPRGPHRPGSAAPVTADRGSIEQGRQPRRPTPPSAVPCPQASWGAGSPSSTRSPPHTPAIARSPALPPTIAPSHHHRCPHAPRKACSGPASQAPLPRGHRPCWPETRPDPPARTQPRERAPGAPESCPRGGGERRLPLTLQVHLLALGEGPAAPGTQRTRGVVVLLPGLRGQSVWSAGAVGGTGGPGAGGPGARGRQCPGALCGEAGSAHRVPGWEGQPPP